VQLNQHRVSGFERRQRLADALVPEGRAVVDEGEGEERAQPLAVAVVAGRE